MERTSLLCTFTTDTDLDKTIADITAAYDISLNNIYVLDNTDSPGSLCLTYNVICSSPVRAEVPAHTISLHRKKSTASLYTINALNELVKLYNNGVLDPNFQIPWEEVRNCILVTAYNQLKKIPTKLRTIVTV